MKPIVEMLLADVDGDIREMMLREFVPDKDPFNATGMASPVQMGYKNWQMLPDPLFFIIQWQELRHENQDRKNSQHA